MQNLADFKIIEHTGATATIAAMCEHFKRFFVNEVCDEYELGLNMP
jgi:hypothetical protein